MQPSGNSLSNVNYFFRRVASSEDVTEAPKVLNGRGPAVIGRVVVPAYGHVVAKATRGAPGVAQRGAFAGPPTPSSLARHPPSISNITMRQRPPFSNKISEATRRKK